MNYQNEKQFEQNRQNDYFARQREAEREMRSSCKKDVAHLSGSSIMRIDGALWMTTTTGRPYQLMRIAPERIFYVKPDPLLHLSPYYVLCYKGFDTPIFLSTEAVDNDKKLISTLIQETGCQIHMTQSKARIAMHLRNYLDMNAIKINHRFYFGWEMKEGHPLYTQNYSTTHRTRGACFDPKFFPPAENSSKTLSPGTALITAEKFADLMDVVSSFNMRCDISLILHISFLYSLLRFWGYRFPFGFCFHIQNSSTVSILKAILCWYEDDTISVYKPTNALLDNLVERKDQPIVIDGAEGSHPNAKLIEDAVRNGVITTKNDPEGLPLQGLACVLSQQPSDFSFSNSFATLEVGDKVFRSDGLACIQNLLPYLQEYFLNLAAYITHHAVRLKEIFDENMSAFRGMDFGYLAPDAECVEAAGIIYSIAELIRDYHGSLAPNEQLSARLGILTDVSCADRMLARFVDASCNADEGTATVNLFTSILQAAIDEKQLIVMEKTTGAVIQLPGPNEKPLILEDDKYYMITPKAMDMLCKKMSVSSPQVMHTLSDSGVLAGRRTNPTTFQTRTRVLTPGGIVQQIAVYNIDKDRLFDPTLYM